MRAEQRWLPANRLLAHDFQIAAYHLRANFASLSDGLTLLAGMAAIVAAARYGLFSLQPLYRPVAVSIAATVIAPYIYYLLARRVAFFRSNSVLADVALDIASARRYVFSIAAISCVVILIALLPPNVSLMLSFFVSFCMSLLIALLLSKAFAVVGRHMSYQKQERWEQLLASRYLGKGTSFAAFGGAAIVFAAARLLDVAIAASIATFTSFALCLWYAPIAYSVVDYERLVGRSPAYSLRSKLRNSLLLGGALAGGALLSLQWPVAGAVAAVFALLLLYKGLEVLIVRAVGGSRAQFLMVTILMGLTSVAIVLPFLILFLLPACGLWLLVKGRRRTWQLS